mmetsp:Transcript_28089/g.76207  ORF Transcript_28089/g.76207 Transcript_28089/m.76207 type:complete len:522 (+) Transcript_28089:141-1706(+)
MYQPFASRLPTAMGSIGIGNDAMTSADESSSSIGGYAALYYSNFLSGFDTEPDTMQVAGFPMIENMSNQCSSPVLLNLDLESSCQNHPENKPSWWLVLRWAKIVLFKIARCYHAKPLLLAIVPLMLGLTIGYAIGRWQYSSQFRVQERSQSTATTRQLPGRERTQRVTHTEDGKLTECFSLLWFRLCLVFSCYFFPEGMDEGSVSAVSGTTSRSGTTKKTEVGCPDGATARSGNTSRYVLQNSETDGESENCARYTPGDVALEARESKTRKFLKSDEGTTRESGVPLEQVPKHIAVIMDGNRRYGKSKYGSAARGHWEGSSKLVEFAKWCISEQIAVLTVFAFSSENWKRDPSEIASLMQIFAKYCDELRVEAIARNIKITVLSTDSEKIPAHVRTKMKQMVNETQHCNGMIMNICMSYGSRGEIVGATKMVVEDVLQEKIAPDAIDENTVGERLLTHNCGGDPDVMIRTSGELRISNFLLWQLAYTEFFFVDKPWPAIEKNDLMNVIRNYAKGRSRRYGR